MAGDATNPGHPHLSAGRGRRQCGELRGGDVPPAGPALRLGHRAPGGAGRRGARLCGAALQGPVPQPQRYVETEKQPGEAATSLTRSPVAGAQNTRRNESCCYTKNRKLC